MLIIKPLMDIYVGDAFMEAWRYIPLLLVSATFSAVASFFGTLYGALKKSFNNMLTTLIGAVANIAVSLVLINYIGLWGAIIGTFAAYFLMGIARMVDVTRFIKMKIAIGRFVINSIILVTQAVLVSLEIQIYLVSAIAILLFVVVNIKFLRGLFSKLKGGKA